MPVLTTLKATTGMRQTRPDGPIGSIPRRIFLDSSVLQTLLRYGEFVYDGGVIADNDRIHRDPTGVEKLGNLRNLIIVAQRGSIELAVSENSLREVRAARDDAYLSWAWEVFEHWRALGQASPLAENATVELADGASLGYLGSGDRVLLTDAVLLNCDTFLTMENRLPRNAPHLLRVLGVYVQSPSELWKRLRPWVPLLA